MKADLIKYWSFDNSGGANRPVNWLNGLETKLSRGCSWFDQKPFFFVRSIFWSVASFKSHLRGMELHWKKKILMTSWYFIKVTKTSKYHLICVGCFHKDDIKKITSTKNRLRKFQIPQFYPVCDQLIAELISKLNIKHFRTEYFKFSFSPSARS